MFNLFEKKEKNSKKHDTKIKLQYTCDIIQETASTFGIDIRIKKVSSTKLVDTFYFTIERGKKLSDLFKLENEFALSLGVKSVRLFRSENNLALEVVKTNTAKEEFTLTKAIETVEASEMKLANSHAILGYDTNGKPLVVNLLSPSLAHMLVCGMTGSGKTVLLRSILLSLAYFNTIEELRFILIDPKGRGLEPLANLPHTYQINGIGVITDYDSIVNMLEDLVKKMKVRDKNKIRKPELFVVIDELADIISEKGDEVRTPLARLVQRGREAGIHIIACTQKPSSALMGSFAAANFPIRLVGSVATKDEARWASGMADSGAEKLNGMGDFLLVRSAAVERFKSAWISDEDYYKIYQFLGVKDKPLETLPTVETIIVDNEYTSSNINKKNSEFFIEIFDIDETQKDWKLSTAVIKENLPAELQDDRLISETLQSFGLTAPTTISIDGVKSKGYRGIRLKQE